MCVQVLKEFPPNGDMDKLTIDEILRAAHVDLDKVLPGMNDVYMCVCIYVSLCVLVLTHILTRKCKICIETNTDINVCENECLCVCVETY